MKTVIFRTDASFEIGSGHVMRCLTIAHKFKEKGFEVKFLARVLQGNLNAMIEKQGFSIVGEMEKVDILVVDHYQLDYKWETEARQFASKIIVIDDLANRQHECDLLLDQNVIENYESRYTGLVPDHCKLLLGPSYLIMRDEFIRARKQAQMRNSLNNDINNLLVFMGGSDPTSETLKVLAALKQCHVKLERINVVVGNSNPFKDEIKRLCLESNYEYHCQINYLAELMANSDFAIGAGGLTMWERCYVGLPSSSTIVADNQRQTTEYADYLGATIKLGWHESVTSETYEKLIEKLPTMQAECQRMSEVGKKITGSNREINDWINEMVGLLDD